MNILNTKLREEKSRGGEWTYVIKSRKNMGKRKNEQRTTKCGHQKGRKQQHNTKNYRRQKIGMKRQE